jgi:hypothetical protein
MKWLVLFEDFGGGSESYIDARLQEISDLVSGIVGEGDSRQLIYEWENKDDREIIVNFQADGIAIKYEFDVDDMVLTKTAGDVVDFREDVETVDAGLEMIEKDVQLVLGIDEKVKAERYKGKKIPGKYLTRKKGAMKKEIDTFRGKKEYKAEWEADMDKRTGKRIKTKKSAATKAYQRMFGKK